MPGLARCVANNHCEFERLSIVCALDVDHRSCALQFVSQRKQLVAGFSRRANPAVSRPMTDYAFRLIRPTGLAEDLVTSCDITRCVLTVPSELQSCRSRCGSDAGPGL